MEWVSACPSSTQLAQLELLPQTQEHTEKLNGCTLSLSLIYEMQEARSNHNEDCTCDVLGAEIDTQAGLEGERQSKLRFPCFQNELQSHIPYKFVHLNQP